MAVGSRLNVVVVEYSAAGRYVTLLAGSRFKTVDGHVHICLAGLVGFEHGIGCVVDGEVFYLFPAPADRFKAKDNNPLVWQQPLEELSCLHNPLTLYV